MPRATRFRGAHKLRDGLMFFLHAVHAPNISIFTDGATAGWSSRSLQNTHSCTTQPASNTLATTSQSFSIEDALPLLLKTRHIRKAALTNTGGFPCPYRDPSRTPQDLQASFEHPCQHSAATGMHSSFTGPIPEPHGVRPCHVEQPAGYGIFA